MHRRIRAGFPQLRGRRAAPRLEKVPLSPIYAAGTLGRNFNRKNTKKITWAEAKALVVQWEAAGKWDDEEARAFPSLPTPIAK